MSLKDFWKKIAKKEESPSNKLKGLLDEAVEAKAGEVLKHVSEVGKASSISNGISSTGLPPFFTEGTSTTGLEGLPYRTLPPGEIFKLDPSEQQWKYGKYVPYGIKPIKPSPYMPEIGGSELTPSELEAYKKALEWAKPKIEQSEKGEKWKVDIMTKIITRLLDKEFCKHPNPSWFLVDFIKANFNYSFPSDYNSLALWLCRETKEPSDNYRKLFKLEEFVLALFGNSGMKLDCDCTEPCNCPGKTIFEIHRDELAGEKPFEYLRDYFGIEVA